MPHLAPLNWLLAPIILSLLIYLHSIFLFFHIPTHFSLSPPSLSSFKLWKW